MNYLDAQVNKIRELKTELKSQHDETERLQLRRTTFPHKNVSPGNTRDIFFVTITRSSALIKIYIF